jgi:sugar-specific transcriptional regulator TrmB
MLANDIFPSPFILIVTNVCGNGLMALERVFNELITLGLTSNEAYVYIYLAKKGPCQLDKLLNALELTKSELTGCLRTLKAKNIVFLIQRRTSVYSALEFSRVLELSIEGNLKQTRLLQAGKDQLISSWRAMFEEKAEE